MSNAVTPYVGMWHEYCICPGLNDPEVQLFCTKTKGENRVIQKYFAIQGC